MWKRCQSERVGEVGALRAVGAATLAALTNRHPAHVCARSVYSLLRYTTVTSVLTHSYICLGVHS
jgi:hypothetical protein